MSTERDMRTRWTPSAKQDEQAAKALKALTDPADPRVFTVHLLLNKKRHFWTPDVEVVPLIQLGVLYSRGEALAAATTALEVHRMVQPFTDVSAGWAVHEPFEGMDLPRTPGRAWKTSWDVFEV